MRWRLIRAEKHSSTRELSTRLSRKRYAKLLTTICSPGGRTAKIKNRQTSNDLRSVSRTGPTWPCALREVSFRANQNRKKKQAKRTSRQPKLRLLTLPQTLVAH